MTPRSQTVRESESLEWSLVRELRAVVPEHVVFRDLPSETVLLNIRTGAYHSMDESRARCFEALRNSLDLQAAFEFLARANGATEDHVRRELLACCSELLSNGLLELREHVP